MSLFTLAQTLANYRSTGRDKAEKPAGSAFILAMLAGGIIALGAAASSSASWAVGNASLAKLISGLIFPFGLGMVVLSGTELFTGNCLIALSVLGGESTLSRMLRSWGIVYLGNLAGAVLVAASQVWSGQMVEGMAVSIARTAATKCSLTFSQGVMLGFWCNLLVCLGVLLSLTAQDTAGRILGAYLPVSFFILCGFEHSIANMYYIPAGLLLKGMPAYTAALGELDLSALTLKNFFLANLLPVTLGNILGGVGLAAALWKGYRMHPSKMQQQC